MCALDSAAWIDAASALNQISTTLNSVSEIIDRLEIRLGLHSSSLDDRPNQGLDQGSSEPAHNRLPWTWVSGETLPYRRELRSAGGRWSRKRQAWYFINCDELPSQLQSLPGTVVTVSY